MWLLKLFILYRIEWINGTRPTYVHLRKRVSHPGQLVILDIILSPSPHCQCRRGVPSSVQRLFRTWSGTSTACTCRSATWTAASSPCSATRTPASAGASPRRGRPPACPPTGTGYPPSTAARTMEVSRGLGFQTTPFKLFFFLRDFIFKKTLFEKLQYQNQEQYNLSRKRMIWTLQTANHFLRVVRCLPYCCIHFTAKCCHISASFLLSEANKNDALQTANHFWVIEVFQIKFS